LFFGLQIQGKNTDTRVEWHRAVAPAPWHWGGGKGGIRSCGMGSWSETSGVYDLRPFARGLAGEEPLPPFESNSSTVYLTGIVGIVEES
jgi:hypothetical protein